MVSPDRAGERKIKSDWKWPKLTCPGLKYSTAAYVWFWDGIQITDVLGSLLWPQVPEDLSDAMFCPYDLKSKLLTILVSERSVTYDVKLHATAGVGPHLVLNTDYRLMGPHLILNTDFSLMWMVHSADRLQSHVNSVEPHPLLMRDGLMWTAWGHTHFSWEILIVSCEQCGATPTSHERL